MNSSETSIAGHKTNTLSVATVPPRIPMKMGDLNRRLQGWQEWKQGIAKPGNFFLEQGRASQTKISRRKFNSFLAQL